MIMTMVIILLLLVHTCNAFLQPPQSIAWRSQMETGLYPFQNTCWPRQENTPALFGWRRSEEEGNVEGDDLKTLNLLRERMINKEIVNKVINGGSNGLERSNDNEVVEMKFLGKGFIGPTTENSDGNDSQTECFFLTPITTSIKTTDISSPSTEYTCIPVPISSSSVPNNNIIQLLAFAYKSEPISKSLCLALSPILINRDGSLYDNLPWSTWTIDPKKERDRDAAGNVIDKKYHLGKRDAYNRFMGKDWFGRSLSIGNIAARAKYLLENDNNDSKDSKNGEQTKTDDSTVIMNDDAAAVLARRVLELEVKECRMAVAAAEEQLAILRAKLGSTSVDSMADSVLIENYDALQVKIQAVQDAQSSLNESEEALSLLQMETEKKSPFDSSSSSSELVSFLSKIIDSQRSNAPYRGAIGYKPTIDTKNEMFEQSVLPYSSPFELMKEIINEQLHADIIGCIIEDSSLFSGSVVLGGALVLRRKSVRKEVTIDGERVVMEDSDDDLGNNGIKSGEVLVVECDSDEAIGMALTCGLDLSLESDVWEKSQVACTVSENDDEMKSIMDALLNVHVADESIILKTQGDGEASEGIPIQVPRSNNGAFRNFFASSENQPVFNTDNPVRSLQEYDELTVQDKAQLLLSLESFKGRLPRPRTLRETESSSAELSPLDEMLVPLIDESVRRQIFIREAENRGDKYGAEELKKEKSIRQLAKERAEKARVDGNDELAAAWDKEADFYASLRADVTQDEGDYSSFLDRDEWYERNRRAVAERNKKRFGSLFGDLE